MLIARVFFSAHYQSDRYFQDKGSFYFLHSFLVLKDSMRDSQDEVAGLAGLAGLADCHSPTAAHQLFAAGRPKGTDANKPAFAHPKPWATKQQTAP